MTWFRALFAAGLSMLLPGAGHALMRDWFRALVFVAVYALVTVFFFPIEQVADAGTLSEGMDVFASETDPMTQFVFSFIALFAAIDVVFRTVGFPPGTADAGDGLACPACGKEVDADLEFCHWCTTRLEPIAREEDADTERGDGTES